jgi:hypothetical protein
LDGRRWEEAGRGKKEGGEERRWEEEKWEMGGRRQLSAI